MNSAFWDKAVSLLTSAGGKILLAIVVYIIGTLIIRAVTKGLEKMKGFGKLDKSVQTFVHSLVRIVLYLVLVIAIIEVLGIPMTSFMTVLASAGLAIGLALQGALSNFAGGIMIMLFKPFKVGDYIEASGAEGNVTDISVFYTKIVTLDNRRYTVPNGSLMNANVLNFSAEEIRRVDLVFKAAYDADANVVTGVMAKTAEQTAKVVAEPAVFARLSGYADNAREYTLRAWCKTEDYWDVYFDLITNVNNAFAENGFSAPVGKINVNINQ